MLLGVQTSSSSVVCLGPLAFCGDLHTLLCREGGSDCLQSPWLSLWVDYVCSHLQKEILPCHPFIMWAALGLSFAVRLESVGFCTSLDVGNNLLIQSALFFPSKRLVYS